uniref:Signal peptidase complex-like protein DTM1 n=1 Tax=Opuntia streptacantha TaxID=393608 RepID=A0A7C9D187_OPUST
MANKNNSDLAFRSSLICLAGVMVAVGLWTHSFKKVVVTYFMGLAGIAGVLLPDWEFFDRDLSQWTQPVTVDHIRPDDVLRPRSTRFRFYPVRTAIYAGVYTFGLYKWWSYVSQ